MHIASYNDFCEMCEMTKKKKTLLKFSDSFIRNNLDLVKIWNVASPAWRLTSL